MEDSIRPDRDSDPFHRLAIAGRVDLGDLGADRPAATDWSKGKGDAIKYPDEEWYELLREADRTEEFILDHWGTLAGDHFGLNASRGFKGRKSVDMPPD